MPQAFKDLLSPALVTDLAQRLQNHYPAFNAADFRQQATHNLTTLAMKDRARHIAHALHAHLPDYPLAIDILLHLMTWDNPTYRGFHFMPIAQYVEDYGTDHLHPSMHALYHMTQVWTGEFAIRPLITRYPDAVWGYLLRWREDANHHVRRLVSEGTRPRLPWASQLPAFIADPAPLFDLLAPLMDDPSDYVRRSVANNLNDISKDHPARLLTFLHPYQDNANPSRRWIIRHALRSLIKQGDTDTLAFLGYEAPRIRLDALTLSQPHIMPGDDLHFHFTLTNPTGQAQIVLLDYIIDYMKANGEQRPKVFKFTRRTLAPHQTLTLERRHSFKPTTTRRLYAGEHRLALQINGVRMGEASFILTV